MKKNVGIGLVGLTLITMACEPDYGETPVAGTTTLALIEQAFTDDLYQGPSSSGNTNESEVLATYNPAPGQICMLYGRTETGPRGAGLDLADVPIYTAQVFNGSDSVFGDYFYGTMFRYDVENRFWERAGEYSYYPGTVPAQFEVYIPGYQTTTVENTGDDFRDFLEVVRPCEPIEGYPTYAPPTE